MAGVRNRPMAKYIVVHFMLRNCEQSGNPANRQLGLDRANHTIVFPPNVRSWKSPSCADAGGCVEAIQAVNVAHDRLKKSLGVK
jgi:hypothetical protein